MLEHHVGFKGNYWCILETDDYWLSPDKIEKQLDFLYAHKDYLGSSHAFLVKNEIDGTELIAGASLPEWDIYECLKNHVMPAQALYCHTSTWMWKNVFLNNPKEWLSFLKDKKLLFTKIFSDVLMQFRMLSYGGKVKYFDEVMSCYRQTGKGVWSVLSKEEQKKANRKLAFQLAMIRATFPKHQIYYLYNFALNLHKKIRNRMKRARLK